MRFISAIVLAAAIVFAALAVNRGLGRYEVIVAPDDYGNSESVYRLDKVTGEVVKCHALEVGQLDQVCGSLEWSEKLKSSQGK